MRIALFSDTYAPQMNGVARTLQRLVAALTDRGHEVRVYTTSHPGARDRADVRRVPSVPFWGYEELRLAPPLFPGAQRELESWRPHVIHAATPFGVGLAGRSLARSLGIPFLTSYHTQLAQYAGHYGLGTIAGQGMRYLRWFHNSGVRTLVPTRAVADQLEPFGFARLGIWSRGVDAARFHPGYRSPALRETMGARDGSLVVAYVGRIASEKGIEVAVDAMREVHRHASDSVFALAGDGPALRSIRRAAPPHTYFAGRLSGDALSAFYASADVFVFPSITDTFGNVLLEAMASGLAVVAADVPQAREVVGEPGIFAQPGDAQAFAAAILRCAWDRDHLDAARRASLIRARSRTWFAVWTQLIEDYAAADASRIEQARPLTVFAEHDVGRLRSPERAATLRHAAADRSSR